MNRIVLAPFKWFQTCRIDTDDDRRISKDEFTSEKIKPIIEKWVGKIDNWDYGTCLFP